MKKSGFGGAKEREGKMNAERKKEFPNRSRSISFRYTNPAFLPFSPAIFLFLLSLFLQRSKKGASRQRRAQRKGKRNGKIAGGKEC